MLKQGLLALLIATTAAASIGEAQPKKGANGGMVATSQGHPIELPGARVLRGDDDGSPLSTKDMRGRATVQDGGKTTTVPLQPAAPNMMVGKLQAPLGSKARVVFSANLQGHSLTAPMPRNEAAGSCDLGISA